MKTNLIRNLIQRRFGAWVFLSCLGCVFPVSAGNVKDDVDAIMRHVDKLWRSDSAHAVMSMTVKTRRYTRTMEMESWSKGSERSLVVIRAPKKDSGIATLKVEDNIWNYLPKINRVTKVPASMMSGSWMGSHFTNDDLVQENTYEDDYQNSLTFSGERDGRAIYEVSATPRPDAPVVWGRVVMELEQKRLLPLRASYFDEEGVLVRTMVFDQVSQRGDRYVPMRMTLTPSDKPDESTVVEYQKIDFDVEISDQLFSLQRLQKGQ